MTFAPKLFKVCYSIPSRLTGKEGGRAFIPMTISKKIKAVKYSATSSGGDTAKVIRKIKYVGKQMLKHLVLSPWAIY